MIADNIKTLNRLEDTFKSKNKNILNVYFTAGYPQIDSTLQTMIALQKNGADIIEIGMPYSDPVADGPVIQQSNKLALQNGMGLQVLLNQLKDIRQHIQVPLILMGYLNPILRFGKEKFFATAAEIGIDGFILPELPMIEYKREYKALLQKYNLKFIFLITPETHEKRIREIDDLSSGFIYAVSSSSTTGSNKVIEDQSHYFKRLQQMKLKNPILVGFGIKDKPTFDTACTYTNGAIIGSAYIKALQNTTDINKTTKEFLDRILH